MDRWARAQGPGRREKTSLSRRSPVEGPAFASSPTISAAEATNSAPPGGRTEPLMLSVSDSKPCLGAGSRTRAAALRRGAGAPARFLGVGRPFERAGVFLLGADPAAVSRAATRRALARWGRV